MKLTCGSMSNPMVLWGLAAVLATGCTAQPRTVGLTFDDLPAVRSLDPADAEGVNDAILAALKRHRAPATAFVNERAGQNVGRERWLRILRKWVRDGHDLGNHTWSHSDLNRLTLDEFKREVISGEETLAKALAEANGLPRYLRFPFNHTGDAKEKRDDVYNFLRDRKYRIATCTIHNSDYEFARAYDAMRERGDGASRRKLRKEYLAHTAAEIDYYAKLHVRVLGRETPHVMLLHANHLNADVMDDILKVFGRQGYRFVTLAEAQSDRAYDAPDMFVSPHGLMWGYRWASQVGIEIDGRLEPQPASWILEYGRETSASLEQNPATRDRQLGRRIRPRL